MRESVCVREQREGGKGVCKSHVHSLGAESGTTTGMPNRPSP